MENNTFHIDDIYIGRVQSINPTTHEIEVYLPKLMPTLNYGFTEATYSIGLQSEVVKTNTILCKPIDFKVRMPKKDSLIHVEFIDGDINKAYWRDFDPNGANEYYEFEKTEEEKTLENFSNMFRSTEDSIYPIKDIKLGTSLNPIYEAHAYLDVKYIENLDTVLKSISDPIINSINETRTIVQENFNSSVEVTNSLVNNVNKLTSGIDGTWKEIGTLLVDKPIKRRMFSGSLTSATASTIDNKFVYTYNLFVLDSGYEDYIDVKGSYLYDGNRYIIGQNYNNATSEFYLSFHVEPGNWLTARFVTTVSGTPTVSVKGIIEIA